MKGGNGNGVDLTGHRAEGGSGGSKRRRIAVRAAVLSAIGGNTEGSEYEQMDRLHEITGVPIPAPLASLRGKLELHTDVIEKEAMLDYVMNL